MKYKQTFSIDELEALANSYSTLLSEDCEEAWIVERDFFTELYIPFQRWLSFVPYCDSYIGMNPLYPLINQCRELYNAANKDFDEIEEWSTFITYRRILKKNKVDFNRSLETEDLIYEK